MHLSIPITVPYQEKPMQIISAFQARTLLYHGCEGFLATIHDMTSEIPTIHDQPIVSEFPEVFPDELPGIPLVREVETGAIAHGEVGQRPWVLFLCVCIVPPKVTRKFKKVSPSKKDSMLVPADEEPVQKGKRVKRSAKKSSTTPTTGIVIREPPVETQSKRKEKKRWMLLVTKELICYLK
nr:putative reverse transcriptase domain-containing protein [Tanacetum cinerariifolium]